MKITMDGKYRYRNGEKAVIVGVNGFNRVYPIETQNEKGHYFSHTPYGKYMMGRDSEHDLVPDESDTTHEKRDRAKSIAEQMKENERLLSSCEHELLKLHIAELEAENEQLRMAYKEDMRLVVDNANDLEADATASKREAESLCMSIYKRKYKTTAPDFGLCDTVADVISQIDNMVAGILAENEALEAEVKRLREALEKLDLLYRLKLREGI